MSLFQSVRRLLADAAQKAVTYATGSGSIINYFNNFARDTSQLELYRTIYNTGGIPAQAVDVYALFMLSPGIKFIGSNAEANETVRVKFLEMQMNRILWLAVTRAINYGDSFQHKN
jgi:hypothetical protein